MKARRSATALPDFPGPMPPDLQSAYACQEAAIALWNDAIAGWKIGRTPAEFEARFGQKRLAGPIFSRAVWRCLGQPVDFPVFVGGFAAVEVEYVYVVAKDAPADKLDWMLAEARAMVQPVHLGVETAGSPLATINALGPTVVVSDFGNNAGLNLGPGAPWPPPPTRRSPATSTPCRRTSSPGAPWPRSSASAARRARSAAC